MQKQPPEVFHKPAILKNFVIFTGKHLCGDLFFIKVAGFSGLYLKRTSTQIFSGEYWRIYKNIYFEELEVATRGVL